MVRECIRNFDKSISMKANKSQIDLLKEEFYAKYIHIEKWDDILNHFDFLRNGVWEENHNLYQHFENLKEE